MGQKGRKKSKSVESNPKGKQVIVDIRRLMIHQAWKFIEREMEELECHPIILVTCIHNDIGGKSAIVIDWDKENNQSRILRAAIHKTLIDMGAHPAVEVEEGTIQ